MNSEETGRHALTDRTLTLAFAVLMLLSASFSIADFMIKNWDYIVCVIAPDGLAPLFGFLFNDLYQEFIWVVAGSVLLYIGRNGLKKNQLIGVVSWMLMIYLFNPYGIPVGTDPVSYFLEVTSAILSVGLIVFGTLIWSGRYKYARALGFIALFYIAYEVLTYRWTVVDAVTGHLDILVVLGYIVPYLPYSALMVLFAYLLFRPEVMPKSLINQLSDAADTAIDTGFSDTDSYMVRRDIISISEMLSAPSRECEGPFQCEHDFRMVTPQRGRTIKVRRWKGEDFLRVTMGSDSGSFDGFRFQIRYMVPDTGSYDDCGRVRIYGEPGMYADITVRDREMSFQELSAMEYEEENRELFP